MSGKKKTCSGCGCAEGEVHAHVMCDMERCPWCGGQLSSCGCMYRKLGYNYQPEIPMFSPDSVYLGVGGHPTNGLPDKVYNGGVSAEEYDRFVKILKAHGRYPYIRWPNLCSKCGGLWPPLFSVPSKMWRKYIEPRYQDTVVCWECFYEIVTISGGAKEDLEFLERMVCRDPFEAKEDQGRLLSEVMMEWRDKTGGEF